MRRFGRLIIGILCMALCACEGTSFQSSVPTYPVSVTIDTRSGMFVHFKPTALNTYVIADKEGYHYNGILVLRSVLDACGYAGVVVYIDMWGNYNAWDLACPHCAAQGKKRPCTIDGIFAVCPECGEQYDVGSGTAVPQKGISREYLRKYKVIDNDGQLIIKQL